MARRNVLRDNGLTMALTAMFLLSVAGMAAAGRESHNQLLGQHGQSGLTMLEYLRSGDFLSALFENWESEFLQMAVYVVLTASLFQRGSAESRDPDDPARGRDKLPWRDRQPVLAWLYEHSLGLTLAVLFAASFALHWFSSLAAMNQQARLHAEPGQSLWDYLGSAELWFESFQNWQSEFLSTGLLVVLSIFLRQRGSPESKPVMAENSETGA